MTDPILIGIGGHKRAGKDVVASFYKYQLGLEVIGFSDPLNDMLKVLNPIVLLSPERGVLRYSDLVEEMGYVDAKEIPEVRRLLQYFGTEIGRKMIDTDIWTNLVKQRSSDLLNVGKSVVVTGVRYPNELKMIESLAGHTLWIDRPGFEALANHTSDTSLSMEDFQHVLVNDGTIGELEDKAGNWWAELS